MQIFPVPCHLLPFSRIYLPQHSLNMRLGGFKASLKALEERKISFQPEILTFLLSCTALTLVTVPNNNVPNPKHNILHSINSNFWMKMLLPSVLFCHLQTCYFLTALTMKCSRVYLIRTKRHTFHTTGVGQYSDQLWAALIRHGKDKGKVFPLRTWTGPRGIR